MSLFDRKPRGRETLERRNGPREETVTVGQPLDALHPGSIEWSGFRVQASHKQRQRTVIIREQVPLVSCGQRSPSALSRRLGGGEQQDDQRTETSHWLARRMRISSTFVPAPRVTVVSSDSNPGRSNRNVCVPGGSSSRCTGRSPRNSPST